MIQQSALDLCAKHSRWRLKAFKVNVIRGVDSMFIWRFPSVELRESSICWYKNPLVFALYSFLCWGLLIFGLNTFSVIWTSQCCDSLSFPRCKAFSLCMMLWSVWSSCSRDLPALSRGAVFGSLRISSSKKHLENLLTQRPQIFMFNFHHQNTFELFWFLSL